MFSGSTPRLSSISMQAFSMKMLDSLGVESDNILFDDFG